MSLSTHVLDASRGRPAPGVTVRLDRDDHGWQPVAEGKTDDDGRLRDWLPAGGPDAGTYRLVFGTGAYFDGLGVTTFYPEVCVAFTITNPAEHHHVPLLLSPFAYSTYRGS